MAAYVLVAVAWLILLGAILRDAWSPDTAHPWKRQFNKSAPGSDNPQNAGHSH